MIGVIISDIMNDTMSMAVWQRAAIGRILRNSFISLILFIFFLLCATQIETDSQKILIPSISSMSSPIIFLLIISYVKLILIKSETSSYWISICTCFFAEIVILIIDVDFELDVPWVIIGLPLVLMCLVLFVGSLITCSLDLIQGISGCCACLSFGGCVVVNVLALDGYIEYSFYYVGSGIAGFFFVFVFFSQYVGNFFLDVVFGHIETDYFYYVNPPRKGGKVKAITI